MATSSGGFFLNAADWLLSRFPGIKNHYSDWSHGKRIFIGFLLYLIILPVIPIALAIILYLHDPQNFMKSTAAKVLGALIVLQLSAFGLIAAQPSVPVSDMTDQAASGQPQVTSTANTKKATVQNKDSSDTTPVDQSSAARKGVQSQSSSKPTGGRYFANCDAAFEQGVFNIPRSDKSYRPALDHNSNGVACEK